MYYIVVYMLIAFNIYVFKLFARYGTYYYIYIYSVRIVYTSSRIEWYSHAARASIIINITTYIKRLPATPLDHFDQVGALLLIALCFYHIVVISVDYMNCAFSFKLAFLTLTKLYKLFCVRKIQLKYNFFLYGSIVIFWI